MSKQMTAVEWLECELIKIPFVDPKKAFEQAKQMEKEQIMDAWIKGDNDNRYSTEVLNKVAEQYYNETFKSE